MAAENNVITIVKTTPTPDNKYLVTTTTTIQPAVTTDVTIAPNPAYVPPTPKAPEIPASALIFANLEQTTNWKGEKDKETAGGATGITSTTSLISTTTPKVRLFNFANTVKGAGWRWSNSFGKNSDVANFCYDIEVMADDWTQVMNLELDMNQVISDGRTVLLCVQSASGSGTWEYTTCPSGKSHWSASNIPTNHKLWPKNTWKRIRIFSRRDAAGIVYYDGIEVDGVYSTFTGASGLSALPLGWTAKTLLLNFQIEAANVTGKVNLSVKNLNMYCW